MALMKIHPEKKRSIQYYMDIETTCKVIMMHLCWKGWKHRNWITSWNYAEDVKHDGIERQVYQHTRVPRILGQPICLLLAWIPFRNLIDNILRETLTFKRLIWHGPKVSGEVKRTSLTEKRKIAINANKNIISVHLL